MARGSIIKRCPVCRKKSGRTPDHVCSPQESAYYIVYRLNRKQKWEFGGYTKKDAERLLSQRVSEINNGAYREHQKTIFKDFAQIWLENCPKSRVKASTFRGYQTDIRLHLTPAFGTYFLKDIKQEQVQGFLSRLRERLDPKTVNNIRLTLYMILDYARKLKYTVENPVVDVKPYKIEHKEMDFLNPVEIRLLLEHSREPFKTLFLTAILTGMRRGELVALQWGDVDWNSNTIFIRRSLAWQTRKNIAVDAPRWEFISPKTKRSIRGVFMSPRLKEALEIHRITAPSNPYDLIFCNKEGNPLDPDHLVSREFLPTLSMAGLRRIRFHDLRHSYASLLIAQGENVKFIQSQLGHTSIQTTMDRYGHLLPVDHSLVGARVDKLVFGDVLSNVCLTNLSKTPLTMVEEDEVSSDILVDSIK